MISESKSKLKKSKWTIDILAEEDPDVTIRLSQLQNLSPNLNDTKKDISTFSIPDEKNLRKPADKKLPTVEKRKKSFLSQKDKTQPEMLFTVQSETIDYTARSKREPTDNLQPVHGSEITIDRITEQNTTIKNDETIIMLPELDISNIAGKVMTKKELEQE